MDHQQMRIWMMPQNGFFINREEKSIYTFKKS